MKTRLTELVGIKHPIIQGAMGLISDEVEFVAAVSNAGALGILVATMMSPEGIIESCERIRELTDKPFGVNIVPFGEGQPYDEQIQAMCDARVPVFNHGKGDPTKMILAAKKVGAIAIPTCGRVKHVVRAEENGADAVIITGSEGGGHCSDVGTMALVPTAVRAVKIPVVAGGGIATPQQFAAALVMGAEGVHMGTRFILTQESPAHPKAKECLQKATEEDTYATNQITGWRGRRYKNKYIESFMNTPEFKHGEGHVDMGSELFSQRAARLTAAWLDGDTEWGQMGCGQGIGLANDLPTVKELIEGMVAGLEPAIERLKSFL
ncbi:NAD(P)H-dependent flavin oxidoreductase [Chloroflexota bacterium]